MHQASEQRCYVIMAKQQLKQPQPDGEKLWNTGSHEEAHRRPKGLHADIMMSAIAGCWKSAWRRSPAAWRLHAYLPRLMAMRRQVPPCTAFCIEPAILCMQ
jgi:cytochrome P450